MNTLSKVLIFAAGAAVGSAVTWKFLNDKYAARAEKEIEEVREYYESKYMSEEERSYATWAENNPEAAEEEKAEYANLVTNYSGEKGGSESMEIGTPPYVITPEEFDTDDEYETMSLVYYTDGVLADDDNHVIEDVKNTVGEDFANHFGEYEDDSVFIRNERLKTDYEILMDYREYSDVASGYTNPKDDE